MTHRDESSLDSGPDQSVSASKPCEHLRFTAKVNVHRHVDDGDPTRLVHPVSFTLEASVICANCNRPFVFEDGEMSMQASIRPMPSAIHGA